MKRSHVLYSFFALLSARPGKGLNGVLAARMFGINHFLDVFIRPLKFNHLCHFHDGVDIGFFKHSLFKFRTDGVVVMLILNF